jgi:hypothetical protein
MSEYQHYEFHTIKRNLSRAEKAEVKKLSSHIAVSSSSAWVEYQWGDFKHDPIKVLERYFDLFVYDTNWGSQQIAFLWKAESVDYAVLQRFVVNDVITVSRKKGHVLLSAVFEENYQDFIWDEDEDDDGNRFASFCPFYTEIEKGNFTALYVLWLKAIELRGTDSSGVMPPSEIRKLTQDHKMLARFLGVSKTILTEAVKKFT